ncbi:ABC transporter ATP-binding protein [Amaricoccus sp.]|uniref:ABC transporter ATP-binding protein n=1 Tax=Amaricoccus sp. TaxID=1872485 RepID=UPI00260260A3|nr:ABC transporter ATP-binding protein [Amaricoccus sp.]HRO11781.1 ABC transporter ATP-binding protein [Amaricoccus sp.]
MTTTTVALHGVTKRYGPIAAVRELDLALHAGEVIALVGHNGAGKTTQIKMMLGLARPTEGRVELLGGDPAVHGLALRREVGYLPESVSFHLALTGRETLGFYARLKGVPLSELDQAFAAVGLTGAEGRAIGTYSKGMRQRLGLAQALLGRPRVLILDEPTSGLDPALRREFYAIVAARAAEGATVLLASHALTELEGRADRVVIVNRGAKIADGTLADLRAIARLPVQIRIRPAAGFAGPMSSSGWQRLPDGSLEAEVEPAGKLPLLAQLLADPGAVTDLTVTEPTLDDLYAHFLQREAA